MGGPNLWMTRGILVEQTLKYGIEDFRFINRAGIPGPECGGLGIVQRKVGSDPTKKSVIQKNGPYHPAP